MERSKRIRLRYRKLIRIYAQKVRQNRFLVVRALIRHKLGTNDREMVEEAEKRMIANFC